MRVKWKDNKVYVETDGQELHELEEYEVLDPQGSFIPTFIIEKLRQAPQYIEIVEPPDDLHQKIPFWSQLLAFQKTGVLEGIRRQGRTLIADEMGLGKTLQGLALMSYFRTTRMVLFCPAIVVSSWIHHLQMYTPDLPFHHVQNSRSSIDDHRLNVISLGLIGSQTFRDQWASYAPQFLLVDESHYMKSPRSLRTKFLYQWGRRAKYVVLMSGTPMNRPMDLFVQVKLICPLLFPDFFHFGIRPHRASFWYAERYCCPRLEYRFGRKIYNLKGCSHESELYALLRSYLLTRRTKVDIMKDLPPKYREKIYLHHLPQKNVEGELLDQMKRLAQEKQAYVLQYLKDIVFEELQNDPSLKILIWAHHHFLLDAIRDSVPSSFSMICLDGRTSMRQRTIQVQRFQEDPQIQIAILGISAIATGITLTAATLQVFTELALTPDLHLQAEDRAHRMGQTQPVWIRYLVIGNSSDEDAWNIINQKTKNIGWTIDNRKTVLEHRCRKRQRYRE